MEHTDAWYGTRLQRYFERHYAKYGDHVAFYVNPAPNMWEFKIPGIGRVILRCDDDGIVREGRR